MTATVTVRVELLNLPIHPGAQQKILDDLNTLMEANGYVPAPAGPFALPYVQYVNPAVSRSRTMCLIAAELKAAVNALHTPSKIRVERRHSDEVCEADPWPSAHRSQTDREPTSRRSTQTDVKGLFDNLG